MSSEFGNLLKSQPGVGILIVDIDGLVFAAERMPVIRHVIETRHRVILCIFEADDGRKPCLADGSGS